MGPELLRPLWSPPHLEHRNCRSKGRMWSILSAQIRVKIMIAIYQNIPDISALLSQSETLNSDIVQVIFMTPSGQLSGIWMTCIRLLGSCLERWVPLYLGLPYLNQIHMGDGATYTLRVIFTWVMVLMLGYIYTLTVIFTWVMVLMLGYILMALWDTLIAMLIFIIIIMYYFFKYFIFFLGGGLLLVS
mgnify:CR=1 FL=1